VAARAKNFEALESSGGHQSNKLGRQFSRYE
jgi:hypothetical protein